MPLPSQQRKSFLVGILVLVLIISVGLNLYDHFIAIPQMQATINNMRVEALKSWLGKMQLVKNILRRAETNFDVKDASVHISWAELFVNLLTYGIDIFDNQNYLGLYHWVSRVTFSLDQALQRVYSGNQTGFVTERNLDQNALAMIENVTTTYQSLENKILHNLSSNGVEPTQQLRGADVLTEVLNLLERIYQISVNIHNYYK